MGAAHDSRRPAGRITTCPTTWPSIRRSRAWCGRRNSPRLAEGAKWRVRKDAEGLAWCDLAWPNLRITLRHFHHQESDFAEHIHGFLGFVLNLAEGNMDARLWEIYHLVSKARQGFGLEIDPAIDDEIAPKFITDLAAVACGFVFYGNSLTDPWGRLLIGPGNERGEGVLYAFSSATERRERSGGRLATLGLATPDSLPVTVADEEALLRDPQEVARRSMALMGVALRSEGVEQPKVARFLQQRGLVKSLSPHELAFLKQAQPDEAEMRKLTWRYEALWTLLWALGHIERLGPPGVQCNAKFADQAAERDAAGEIPRPGPIAAGGRRFSTSSTSITGPTGTWSMLSKPAARGTRTWTPTSSTSGTTR